MSRIIRLALATLGLLLGLSVEAWADGGVVQGQVVNGTAGATTALAGLPVRLYVFSGDALKDTRRASTDAQGMFRFEGLPTGGAWSALAAVDYAGVEYQSKELDLAVSSDLNGDIAVYETTIDDSALTVEGGHLIVEMGQGQLELTELVVIDNRGDRSYVGSEEVIPGRRATARIPLPAGATDAAFSSPEAAAAMIRTGKGFVDTRPVIPGQQHYVLSYALPCEGSTYNLLKPVAYQTASMDVLIAAPGAEIDAPALERLGTQEASGASYLHLAGRSLARGTDILIRFSGLGQAIPRPAPVVRGAQPPAGASGGGPWQYLAGLLALGALLPATLIYLRREEPVGWPAPGGAASALEVGREQMLTGIAELDERYEAGDLDESSYRRQREEAKKALLSLMLSSESGEGDGGGKAYKGTRASGGHRGGQSRKEVRPRGRAPKRRPKAG